ncbi:MAG: hypothetical protein QXG54_05785 [Desulfurococcaceae archaeon]
MRAEEMGLIKHGSIVVELLFPHYTSLLDLLDFLAKNNLENIGILLEPVLVDTLIEDRVVSVAVPQLSIVIEDVDLDLDTIRNLCRGSCRPLRAVRNAWANLAKVNTALAVEALKVLASNAEVNIITSNLVVELFHGSECLNPLIVETMSLKYPFKMDASTRRKSPLRTVGITTEMPLAVCTDEPEERPIALLTTSDGERILRLKKPRSEVEYSIYAQIMLDLLVYISTESPSNA